MLSKKNSEALENFSEKLEVEGRSLWQDARRRFMHNRAAVASLVVLVLAISVIGIFMVRSARPEYMTRQILGVVLGVAVMVVISLIDYNWVLNFYWLLYGINLILLIAVLLVGTSSHGATRWLDLGFVQFQPSDLAKILTILFFARFLMDREESIKSPKTILQAVVLILPTLALIVMQPNLSTTICVAALFCALLYIAGLSYKIVGPALLILIPAVIIFLTIAVQPNQPLLKDYQQKRILAWLEPEKYTDEDSYQQLNSVKAIGSGQLLGKGYDNDEELSTGEDGADHNRKSGRIHGCSVTYGGRRASESDDPAE